MQLVSGLAPEQGPQAPALKVLVVDDEPLVRQALKRVLAGAGYEVVLAEDGQQALECLAKHPIDLVVTDVAMPNLDGLSFLRQVREHSPDLPVILVAGAPTTDSAISALRYRATEYLAKPIDPTQLLEATEHALRMDKLAGLRREALHMQRERALTESSSKELALPMQFNRALDALYMVYQPIVSWSKRDIFGYEALVRSSETSLPHPGALFDAAERLDRVSDLGRQIRGKCTAPMPQAHQDTSLFVNLHTRDLLDETLYDPHSELSRWASRVVLEITERATIDDVDDIAERMARLRRLGFRIAIDDIGAGYSGLNCFATIRPDLVKLDITLVRGINADPVRRRLVSLLIELCDDLGIAVVGEGVETLAERDTLVALGLDLLQGYLFARPNAPFPKAEI